jgi:hypothetical protein
MGFYAYALVAGRGASTSLGRGAFREPLRRAEWGSGAVVVGARRGPPQPTAAAVRAQLRVVQRLAEQFPAILPFRFGSFAASASALREGLASQSGSLRKALRAVSGCIQMTVELIGRTRAAPRRGRGAGGRAYLEHAQALQRWSSSAPELLAMRRRLRPLIRSERASRNAGGVRVFHLVPRRNVDAYREVWRDARLPGLRYRISGPHPPFAFAPEVAE